MKSSSGNSIDRAAAVLAMSAIVTATASVTAPVIVTATTKVCTLLYY